VASVTESASPLTVTGAVLAGERVGLRAEGGRIAELGPGVEPRPGDDVLDADGTAIVPGLVNAHTHGAMTLFRGYGDDMPLMEWLQKRIWPVEGRLEPDDVYWGTRLACVEMIRTGTVMFWDMYWQPAATARAVEDAGIRAVIGAPLIDGDDPSRSGELRGFAEHSIDELAGFGDRISSALAPHAIYTVSEPSLRWIAEASAERELPIHIHLSETEQEVHDCLKAHGARPAAYVDGTGLLGHRTQLAHAVWLDEAELDLVADRDTALATNPVANLKLAVGKVFPYSAARDRGIAVGLGTDGAGSNNALDLFQDMKAFALVQKHEARDPAAVTATEAWEIATGRRSALLGHSGLLEAGEPADFLLLRSAAPELSLGELTADLVYAASGSVVDATVVDGRVLMRGGIVEGADEVVARAVERAVKLGIA
jgi:5-methylthioadenosine/S-adenosylhomocysteine deaminase